MRKPWLEDVVVRARGLAGHLLHPQALRPLARCSGSGALARALEDLGYWPAPTPVGLALSAARVVERAIDHETLARLALLVRWLGDRREPFAGLFELEVRDTLRIRLRELAAGAGRTVPSALETSSGWAALRRLRAAIARVADVSEMLSVLTRLESPYASPMTEAWRAAGDDSRALGWALDHAWADHARGSATPLGGALLEWVEDEIDLRNAWQALAGVTGSFLEGGRRLPPSLQASIAAEGDETRRRRQLARAFSSGAVAGVFDDLELGLDRLEARARVARVEAAHRAARLDPIGASPILEVVLRIRAERADLRGIGWGVAAGLPPETIVGRLGAPP